MEDSLIPQPANVDNARPAAPKERHSSRLFTEYYASAFLFLLAAFVLVAFFVLRPLILRIREINSLTQSRIDRISSERGYLSSLEQSVAAAQTIPPTTLDDVQRALPNDQNIPSLLVQFGSAAVNNNLRIDSISFSDTRLAAKSATTSLVIPLDVGLTIHARTYFDVKRFLSEVETSLRIMDVITISSSGAGGELSYTLQLRTYTFKSSARTATASP
jgi:Tfp pilus assembly protein PilO